MANNTTEIRKSGAKYEVTSYYYSDGMGRSFCPRFSTLRAAKAFVARDGDGAKRTSEVQR